MISYRNANVKWLCVSSLLVTSKAASHQVLLIWRIFGEKPCFLILLSYLLSLIYYNQWHRVLRLSYNQFTSSIPEDLIRLNGLDLVHLQSNMLTGTVSLSSERMVDPSSFISDCGVPTAFEDTLTCDNCTMCCNGKVWCHSVLSFTYIRHLSLINPCLLS
jgi:hypothetical protein